MRGTKEMKEMKLMAVLKHAFSSSNPKHNPLERRKYKNRKLLKPLVILVPFSFHTKYNPIEEDKKHAIQI